MADWDNRIPELDETNNALCSASPITVPADLIMSAVSTTATGAAPGGSISLSNTAKNQGTSSTNGSFTIGFHLSTNTIYGDGDDIASVTVRSVGTLAANATSAATTSVVVPASTPIGMYYVCAMADINNTVAETNETNNTLCTATPVAVGPDLTFTALTGPASGTHVAQGASFNVTDTVKNQGGSTTGVNTTNAYHLSTDTTYGNGDDIAIVATRTVIPLSGGSSQGATTPLTVPLATPNGTYYICAMADSTSVVAEANETNNTACTTTTIIVP
jgi:subtilase family serine protease